MDREILVYLGAALMVVLALVAFRYWNSTASYALRKRESHALKQRSDLSAPTRSGGDGDASPKDDGLDQVENSKPATDQSAEPPAAREASRIAQDSARDDPGTSAENPGVLPEMEDPQVDEHGRKHPPEQIGGVEPSTAARIKELDEQLAALPSGIDLIDLPILERRRIADLREELLSERRRLATHPQRGTHRRRRRSQEKG